MKRITLIVVAVLSFISSKAGDTIPLSIKNPAISINRVNNFSISIIFGIDLDNVQIDGDYWTIDANKPKFHFVYEGIKQDKCNLDFHPFISGNKIGIIVINPNSRTIKYFFKEKNNQITLQFDQDLIVHLNEPQNEFGLIKKEDLNNLINKNLSISDDQRTSYLTYVNNFYYYENSLDFGVQPNSDSMSTSYFLTFKLQNKYNLKNFLSCNTLSLKHPNPPQIYWNLEGRISTNFSDSLNYINYYPLNLSVNKYDGLVPHELNFKLGNEANQTFTNKRAIVDGSYTFIIPNLINLTTPSANRLRLKPILTAGIKAYYDYSNDTTHFASGQAFLGFHYYIPVFNNYALILDEQPFYDFSKAKNPNHKVNNQYSIILGAEIPKTGFKAMFKYVNGKSNINYKQGKIIGLGLLIDFFQEKQMINSSKP